MNSSPPPSRGWRGDPSSTGAPAGDEAPVAVPLGGRRRGLLALKFVVACGAVALLLYLVGVQPVVEVLGAADLRWLPAAVLFIALGFVMNALSLLVLYRGSRRGRIGLRRFCEAFFASAFIASWLPGRVGDLSIAYLARREVPVGDSVTYVLADKLITVAVLAAATITAIDRFLGADAWYWPSVVVSILIGAPLVLWLTRRLASAPVGWLPEAVRARLAPVWETLVHLTVERRGALAINLVITVVRLVVVGAALTCLLAMFGTWAPLVDAALATGAIQLLAVFPISIQGIGVTEGAYIVLLGEIGVPAAAILATGLVGRLISVALLGLFHVAFTGFAWVRAET